MNKNLVIFLIISLAVGGGLVWYSIQTTKEVNNNIKLPNETEIEAPENGEEEQEIEEMTIEIYLGNSELSLNPEQECSKVFLVERTIEKTEAPARKAVELLIAGPTEKEKEDGYLTSINTDTEINSLSIEDGTAYIDFSEELEKEVGGSCLVRSIRNQIKETLKQFATVNNVIISVEGETETILQP